MSGSHIQRRLVAASFAALSALALAGCVPLSDDRPASSPTPSPTASDSGSDSGTAAENIEIPDTDLSLAAGADLPDGLAVSVGTSLAGDADWKIEPASSGPQTYRHVPTGCTVEYASGPYAADSDDDREATLQFLAEEVGISEDPEHEISAAYPYDTSGVPGATASEHQIEFIGYAFGPDSNNAGDIFTTVRAIPATGSVIVIEFECDEPDVLTTIVGDAQNQFTIGLYPADLFGG
ncbi:hypothetical protein [Microbacterium sp. NPDC090003]|uniref:hypothetical protein n=1 Tax=Microbacterium sp. NPDC090003 TaxID=3364203 RepID=UPI0037F6476C